MSAPADLRRSVPEGIARLLRDRILSGELRPHEPLREAALAAEFDASRNTIREVLVRLEHQGLARKNAHRGSRVANPDLAEIREIMALRRVVEPGAIRILAAGAAVDGAAARAPVDRAAAGAGADRDGGTVALAGLRALAASMEAAAAASDWERYGVLDLVFHGDLVAAAGSRRLAEEFRRALRPLQLRLLAVDLADVTTGSRHHVAEHGAILDAIASGDPGRALDLIDRHLADVEAVLFEAGASS